HIPFLARKIRADHVPTLPAVGRFEQDVAGVIKRLLIHRREDHRGRAQETILAAAHGFRRYILRLTGRPIVLRDLAAVSDVRVDRVGGDIAVFFNADSTPTAPGDRAIIAPASYRRRAALLLTAVDPVRPAIVCDDMIHLRRRLVVPTAPRLAAIDGN